MKFKGIFFILQMLHLTLHKCFSESVQVRYDSLSKAEFCPQWTKKKASGCVEQQYLSITPTSGFGNMLNGVLQGYLIAYVLNRCLVVHWSYGEFLSTSINHTNIMKLEAKVEGMQLSFPTSLKGFKKLLATQERGVKNLKLDVGYRDQFCKVVRSNMSKLGLQSIHLKSLQKSKSLCVFLEGCILRHFLRPSRELSFAIRKIEAAWIRSDTISVAIQVRMGDYASISPSEQHILKTSYDKRIPYSILDLFWDTAKEQAEKELHKRGKKFISFFVATDSTIASDDARRAFQEEDIHFTAGKLRHSDLGSTNRQTDLKMLADWYLISQADIVIQGPWSSYVEKALLNSARKQQIVRCHSLHDGSERKNRRIISQKGDWGCFANVLQDTLKGPRAVDC